VKGDLVLISCEHASNDIPQSYRGLGLAPDARESHIAWDRGAREIARVCAERLGCAYHEGIHTRLLVDLNRAASNPAVIPRVAFGVTVPGNAGLTAAERAGRIRLYHEPYRAAVIRDIEAIVANQGTCCHFSIHTFTPTLEGVSRDADIGVLYDPKRWRERVLAVALTRMLHRTGWKARRNYPYRGTNDGLTTHCRRRFAARNYIGVEIEINQRILPDARAVYHAGHRLCIALQDIDVAAPALR